MVTLLSSFLIANLIANFCYERVHGKPHPDSLIYVKGSSRYQELLQKHLLLFALSTLEMTDFLSFNDPDVLLQMMEDIDSDFSDDDFSGFIDDNDKQHNNCFFLINKKY